VFVNENSWHLKYSLLHTLASLKKKPLLCIVSCYVEDLIQAYSDSILNTFKVEKWKGLGKVQLQ
jgi:hypothetical protein